MLISVFILIRKSTTTISTIDIKIPTSLSVRLMYEPKKLLLRSFLSKSAIKQVITTYDTEINATFGRAASLVFESCVFEKLLGQLIGLTEDETLNESIKE
jgi:hypothetical protein